MDKPEAYETGMVLDVEFRWRAWSADDRPSSVLLGERSLVGAHSGFAPKGFWKGARPSELRRSMGWSYWTSRGLGKCRL